MKPLNGKTIAVTGGGGILCGAIAEGLAASGARIAVLNRTPEKGERVARRIVEAGGTARAFQCDVLVKDDLVRARAEVEAAFGGYDILINGAGGNDPRGATQTETWQGDAAAALAGPAGSFFAIQEAGVRAVFDMNFVGAFLTAQVFAPGLLGRPGASIINVSSMGAFAPMTKGLAYCAAKAAINNFTQWLAVHFAGSGVRVNAIAPGFFTTDQNRKLLWNEDGTPTARTRKILDHTPMGRLGEPADLIGTARWLCDDAASGFVTGAVIPVDGGFMAYSGV
jgi:NAD(P)-dependent dehydrogenase (short-subunit alcohol dehydrogenase family)